MMPNRKTMTLVTVICTTVAAAMILIALVLVFFVKPSDTAGTGTSGTDTGTTDGTKQSDASLNIDNALLPETADAGTGYIDSIIFLGDSTTYHMLSREVLSGGKNSKQVWTGKEGYLNLDSKIRNSLIVYPDTGEEMTIEQAVTAKKPARMVITLGIDYGVAWLTDSEFETYYKRLVEIVKSASPETKIILQSIFPVSKDYEADHPKTTNAAIDAKNKLVQKVAAECGVRYLDTASVLKGTDNCMLPAYDAGDGCHYKVQAYQAILKYIRTHAYGN